MKHYRITAALLALTASCALTACGGKTVTNTERGNNAPAQDSQGEKSSSNENGLANAEELAKKLLAGNPDDPRQLVLDTTNFNAVYDAAKIIGSENEESARISDSDLLDRLYAQIGLDEKGIAAYKQNAGANGQSGKIERIAENPALCEKYGNWLNNGWLEYEDAFLDGEMTREQVDALKADFRKPEHLYVVEMSDATISGSRAGTNIYISQIGDEFYFDYFIEDDDKDVFSEITSFQVAAADAWSTEG